MKNSVHADCAVPCPALGRSRLWAVARRRPRTRDGCDCRAHGRFRRPAPPRCPARARLARYGTSCHRPFRRGFDDRACAGGAPFLAHGNGSPAYPAAACAYQQGARLRHASCCLSRDASIVILAGTTAAFRRHMAPLQAQSCERIRSILASFAGLIPKKGPGSGISCARSIGAGR
jgi:hypothetical protein